MAELDDHQLLAEFARENSETAFAALVEQHLDLVYSVALRSTGNPHTAQEIAHAVYACYFKLNRADVYIADVGNQNRCANYGSFGVFVDDRMVTVISMYALQCGWPQSPRRAPGCMKFILNIYTYAMIQGR